MKDDELESAEELTELPEIPDPPVGLSTAMPDLGAPVTDDDALKKMGRRTTPFGRIVTILLVLGAIGLGVFWWTRYQRFERRWDAYNEAQEQSQNTDDFLRRLREILPQTDDDEVKVRILQKFAQYQDSASVTLVAQQLESNVPTVRAQAARTLAAIGSPHADAAKPALLRVLPSTDARDRAPVVWALAVLGESAAADAIIDEFSSGRLQGQPGFDARVIANVLGPQRLASDALINHDEVAVRTLTAQALAEAASADVIDPLARMVDFELQRPEPDENVLRAIASGLGRAGDPRAGQPLFRILERQPRMRSVVLDSLRKTVGAPGVAALIPAAQDVSVKRELVRMLSLSHDPRAADTLAGFVSDEDADIRQDAAFGLAELGDARGLETLIALARGEDLTVARDALNHIKNLGAESAADGLAEMLEDETNFLGRRASVLRALGTTGATQAGPAIERFLESDDVASAAAALADLDYDPAFDRLARMIPRPRDVDFATPTVANETAFMNRTAAVRAIGRYGRSEVAPALMTIIEDPQDDRRLRQDAGFALGAVADNDVRQQVLAKIRDTNIEEIARRYYMAALWQRPDPTMVNDLLDLIQSPDTPPDVKRASALAVGYTASPAADDRITQMLEAEATRREAAFAIVLGGNEAQARALLGRLGQDQELRGIVQDSLLNQENDWFNLITGQMFESGQIFRRLRVAQILNEGEGDNRHGYAWQQVITRLRAGWDGHDGVTPREIRRRLWDALRGDDPERRRLVAAVFAAMDERGLLMAARDQSGPGREEARDALRRMNAPEQQQQGR
ncbi:MAG: HEAT repeat domain-containing protein [Sandaracinaceae bacterium]|nr:HEAT repeat domain-containing protein [Sandaracinaceae bacterium]